MSLKTWLDQIKFYPIPDDMRDAILHSLRKWRALDKDSLKMHSLYKTKSLIHESEAYDENNSIQVNSKTCALCVVSQRDEHLFDCKNCPLYLVRSNTPCDELMDGEEISPYFAFVLNDDTKPMVKWLEETLKFYDNNA